MGHQAEPDCISSHFDKRSLSSFKTQRGLATDLQTGGEADRNKYDSLPVTLFALRKRLMLQFWWTLVSFSAVNDENEQTRHVLRWWWLWWWLGWRVSDESDMAAVLKWPPTLN